MANAFHFDSEVFRLALAAGFYHPDPEARGSVRSLLDTWLSDLGNAPGTERISEVISAETGTTIEPFVLTSEDLECAVYLVRAAFSEAGAQTRFRIVSRETIGRNGGLVLTRNLKSFYSERYVHGKRRHQQKVGWSFVPSALPTAGADFPTMISATVSSEDEGFRVVVPVPECRSDPATFARQLQKYSGIQGVEGSLSSLGLRVECHDGEVHVLSGSPESMIRTMAYMIEHATLVLKGEPSASDIPLTLVRLDIPEDGPIPLQAMIGSTSSYSSWMTGDVSIAVHLKKKHKLAISSWLRPHPKWIDSVLEKLS
jgi:hypothetical protein